MNGCHGPDDTDCVACVDNAENVGGACRCKALWSGKECQYYNGECVRTCNGCHGPLATDCDECLENAVRDSTGACVCKPEWTDDYCLTYTACDPICQKSSSAQLYTCEGPGTANCHACVENAYRNWEGACVCSYGWGGADCTVWHGECDPKCDYDCTGPSASDCVTCAENAVIHIDGSTTGTCVCADWWTGDDCSIYRGECAPTCHGCIGPHPDQCQDCVANAYYDGEGTCVCKDGWSGSDCTQLKKPCHHTCEVCLDTNLNECVVCAPGFTLVNGYCIECTECCKTCEAANGDSPNKCTSCHPGYGLATDGTCQPCHPSCKTCSAAWDETSCETCQEDSTLAVTTLASTEGRCICDFPKVRLTSSWTCENSCPTGKVLNTTTKTCEDDAARGTLGADELDVYLNFEQPLPGYNIVSPAREEVTGVRSSSCKPPYPLGYHRGAYFASDQFITLEGHIVAETYSVELWTKVNKAGLITLNFADFFSGWDYYVHPAPPCTCDPEWNLEEQDVWLGEIHFWVTECYTPVLSIADFGPSMTVGMTRSHGKIAQGWTKLGYSLETTSYGSEAVIFSDNTEMDKHTFSGIAIYRPSRRTDLRSLIGGQWDVAQNTFTGYVYDYKYAQISIAGSYGSTGFFTDIYDVNYPDADIQGNEDHFNTLDQGLIDCDWDFYLDFDNECKPCDPTCTKGCTTGDVCYECHYSCATCSGPENNQCVTCYCAADISPQGTCECADSYYPNMLEDGVCVADCFIEGCLAASCEQGSCLNCGYGYHWKNFNCERCREEDCTDLSLMDLPLCEEKQYILDNGVCSCDEGSDIAGYECRYCGHGCQKCNIDLDRQWGYCSECKPGFYLHPSMIFCMLVPDVTHPPISWYFEGNEIKVQESEVFDLDFYNIDWSVNPTVTRGGSYAAGAKTVSWTIQLEGGNLDGKFNRHDSVNHPTRGFWFDGRYDFLQFSEALPPNLCLNFWVRTEHGGALFSTNGVYDEDDQNFISVGIRGKRMNMSVQEGEQFFGTHHGGQNWIGPRSSFIPPESIHAVNSRHDLRHYYGQTDMDVINHNTWQLLSYNFGQTGNDIDFKFYADGVAVDTFAIRTFMEVWHDSPIYPTRNLIGAVERMNYPTDMFRGFIYSFKTYNYNNMDRGEADFTAAASCGSCGASCTGAGVCLGLCEWNEYLNQDGNCQRCPDWCREGCENGLCPVPTHHERFP